MKLFLISVGCFLITFQSYSQVPSGRDSILNKITQDSIRIKNPGLFLDPVEITAIRAGDKSPFTKVTLGASSDRKTK